MQKNEYNTKFKKNFPTTANVYFTDHAALRLRQRFGGRLDKPTGLAILDGINKAKKNKDSRGRNSLSDVVLSKKGKNSFIVKTVYSNQGKSN